MYRPHEAVAPGFLDRVVRVEDLEAVSRASAAELAEEDPAAHLATKLRARATALSALRAAIDAELVDRHPEAAPAS